MKYKSILIDFAYRPKKHLSIRKIISADHPTKNHALGHIHNAYGMSYLRERKDKQIIVSKFQWGWKPTRLTICFVIKQASFSIDLSEPHNKRKITEILDELILINQKNDFGSRESSFPDHSIEMSMWDWQENIPKGYALLKEGDIILENDMEYSRHSKSNYWGCVNHYNVGKPIKMEQGITFVSKNMPDNYIPGHIDPIICRKINNQGKDHSSPEP